MHLLTLSSLCPHPKALKPVIRYENVNATIQPIFLTERLIGRLADYRQKFDLVIWDWYSGEIVSVGALLYLHATC